MSVSLGFIYTWTRTANNASHITGPAQRKRVRMVEHMCADLEGIKCKLKKGILCG